MEELLNYLNDGKSLLPNSTLNEQMHEISVQTRKRLADAYAKGALNSQEMRELISSILERDIPKTVDIWQPFYMDFGKNITFGEGTFINANVHMQDQGGIRIGKNVLIGHQVVLATLDHDLDPTQRGILHPAEIVIEDDVWIGANATILKGVTIGRGSIVSAGSIVTKDVPQNVVVAGVPAKVIKEL